MLLDLLKIKKIFSVLSGTSLAGVSLYYGVFMPAGNPRSLLIIPGSRPSLKSFRSNANKSKVDNSYYVDDMKDGSGIPSILPMLKYEDLQENIKSIDFSPNIRESLIDSKARIINPKTEKRLTGFKHIDKQLFQTAIVDTGLVTHHSVMAENEIPNKITVFSEWVNEMQKTDFIHDLVLSLAEESNNKQTISKQ